MALAAASAAYAQTADESPADPLAWQVQVIDIAEAPRRLLAPEGLAALTEITVETASGAWYALADCDAGLCAALITNPRPLDPLPIGALPGSKVAFGRHSLAQTWLAEPVQRIDGTTLGGAVAGTLVVEDTTARTFRLDLPISEAFEDRHPRVADLGPDHPDTILVVRSSVDQGASLAAIGLTGEGLLQTLAQTEPVGAPRGWLNPIGAADFTGSGAVDVALVVSPDADGRLQLQTLSGHTFQRRIEISNVSNHIAGSDTIDMAVIADFDGDKVPDVAIPSGDRSAIRILSFRDGQVAEPARIELPSPVVTELAGVAAGPGKRPHLLMGLADGRLVLLH
jgi:hypothetical protein